MMLIQRRRAHCNIHAIILFYFCSDVVEVLNKLLLTLLHLHSIITSLRENANMKERKEAYFFAWPEEKDWFCCFIWGVGKRNENTYLLCHLLLYQQHCNLKVVRVFVFVLLKRCSVVVQSSWKSAKGTARHDSSNQTTSSQEVDLK